jgi:hypothetical protein
VRGRFVLGNMRAQAPPACCVYFLLILLLAACGRAKNEGADAAPLFPSIESRNANAPKVLAVQTWLARDEEPKAARNLISRPGVPNPLNLPLGPGTRVVGEFIIDPKDGPLTLVLDYAGFATAPLNQSDTWVVVNIAFTCGAGGGRCSRTGGFQARSQHLFSVSGGMEKRKMEIVGVPREVHIGRAFLPFDLVTQVPVRAMISFNSPEGFETHRLNTAFVQGDIQTETRAPRPAQRKEVRITERWKFAASVAVFIFAWLAWRLHHAPRAEEDNPPRIFATLMMTWGALMALAGIGIGLAYFLSVGVLAAFTGLLLFYGRIAALPLYGATLALVWVWSGLEVGPAFKPVAMQVTLPTLIGFYVFSWRIRSRLGAGWA